MEINWTESAKYVIKLSPKLSTFSPSFFPKLSFTFLKSIKISMEKFNTVVFILLQYFAYENDNDLAGGY